MHCFQKKIIVLALTLFFLVSESYAETYHLKADNFSETFREVLINTSEHSVINLPEGHFHFDRSLNLGMSNITIKGAGPGKTLLDFTHQKQGAQAMLIRGHRVVLEGFSIINPKGDGLVMRTVAHNRVSNVHVSWEKKGDSQNGGYGIYPVGSNDIVVERCKVSGASDAGIYIGQSYNGIVRNNSVQENVIGIHAENTTDVELYDNDIENNAVGLVVSAMPGHYRARTERVRVYNNRLINNNHNNFATEGNLAKKLPRGIGLFLLAADTTEVFDNTFEEHAVSHAVVASHPLLKERDDSAQYNPFSEEVYFYKNKWEELSDKLSIVADPDEGLPIHIAIADVLEEPVNLIWDGITIQNPSKRYKVKQPLCINEPLTPVLLSPNSTDIKCQLPLLEPGVVDAP